jgi:two-component system phosphate regulon sensor histidine kinase PhoR
LRRKIFKSLIWLALGTSIAGLAPALCAALIAVRTGGASVPALAAAAAAALLLGLLAGYAAAGCIAKRIVKELNDIDFDRPHCTESLKELAPLIERIRRRDDLIDRQMAELEKKQNEFRMITENMREGFLIADAEGTLVTYNSSALRLLGASDNVGKENISLLCGDEQYKAAVRAALEGVGTSKVLKIENRYCHIFASPSLVNGRVTGIVMVILDVPEKEQWEELRREFTPTYPMS